MQYERVLITREDGSTAILSFITEGRGSILPEGATWVDENQGTWTRPSQESLVTAEVERAVPDYLAWHRISEADIPTDRTYRNAWHHDGKQITHDMSKARELHRELIRHERARVMPELDAQWMRAIGQNTSHDGASKIEAQRQAWRDAPADSRIDEAKTINELRVLITWLSP
jgi:hypothetical protein